MNTQKFEGTETTQLNEAAFKPLANLSPYEAIGRLAALEQAFQTYPANKVPILALLEERELRRRLASADRNGELNLGTSYEYLVGKDQRGSLQHIAHKLLEEYATVRAFAEAGDLEELNEEAPEEERVEPGELLEEAEEYYYAAVNLLVFSTIGDPLDLLARSLGFANWEASAADDRQGFPELFGPEAES